VTSPDPRPRRQTGAEPLVDEPRRKRGLAWLLGLLLLLLIAGAVFLLVRNAGDDNDKKGVDVTDEKGSGTATDGGSASTAPGSKTSGSSTEGSASTSAGSDSTTSAGDSSSTAPTSSSAPTSGPTGGAGGALTSGSQTLLPPPDAGLGSVVGDPVTGTATVESVIADEAFWVGKGPGDRVLVHLTPEARNSAGESPFQVKPGQTIMITGSVTALPSDPTTLGVAADEGADELKSLGGYIEAKSIALK